MAAKRVVVRFKQPPATETPHPPPPSRPLPHRSAMPDLEVGVGAAVLMSAMGSFVGLLLLLLCAARRTRRYAQPVAARMGARPAYPRAADLRHDTAAVDGGGPPACLERVARCVGDDCPHVCLCVQCARHMGCAPCYFPLTLPPSGTDIAVASFRCRLRLSSMAASINAIKSRVRSTYATMAA